MLYSYLGVFLKMLLLSFSTSEIIPKIFIGFLLILLLCFLRFFYKTLTKKTLIDLKIENWPCTLFLTGFYILIIFLPFYVRYLRIQKTYDLTIILQTFKLLTTSNNYLILIFNIIFYFLIILTFIYIIMILRKVLFFHFLSLHIYIMSYFSTENFFHISIYESICNKIVDIPYYILDNILNIICRILYYFANNKNEFNNTKYINYHMNFLLAINYYVYRKNISFVLLSSFIIYDIFFNNLIIKNTFIMLLIVYIFVIIDKITNIICFIEKSECLTLFEFFTIPIQKTTNSHMYLLNNIVIEKEKLNDINDKLLQAFYIKEEYDYRKDSFWLFKEKKMARLCFFIVNVLCTFYLYFFCNIRVSFFSNVFQFNLYSIIIPLLIIQFFLWKRSNKILKYVFWLISHSIIFLTIIIYCNHTILSLFLDIIYDNSYFCIKDFFTLKQKIYYFENCYILNIKNNPELTQDQKKILYDIYTEFREKEYILQNFNITEIKLFLINLPEIYLYLNNFYEQLLMIKEPNESALIFIKNKLKLWLSIKR